MPCSTPNLRVWLNVVGSWVVGRGRGSWVWVVGVDRGSWVVGVGKCRG